MTIVDALLPFEQENYSAGHAHRNSGEAFIRCIDRLQEVIQAETEILRAGGKIDFESLNLRKTHAFLEFLQMSKNASPQVLAHSAERVKILGSLLSENAEILKQRLRAIQEIAAIIVASIRADESDGTYKMNSKGGL